MTLDITPLLHPVSEAEPAGQEARSSEAYETVAAEIEKLTSLSGASPIDWGLIEQEGAKILATESKDFMLAAWVSAAWLERHKTEGLKAGLQLHAGLVEAFWETGFPPVKRLRGRRNALSWWLERVTDWLGSQTLPPLAPETHRAIVEAATRLDQLLADNDPEAPPLSNLVRQLKSLDVLESPAEAPAKQDASTASQESVSTAGPPTVPPPAQAPSTEKSPVNHSALAPPGTAPINSLDDIIAALTPVAQHLEPLSAALLTLDRFHPLAIEIGRFAARAALLEAPPSQNGATALMPPPVAIVDALQTVCGTGNADGIIEFCESRILTFPFWLDLDCQSARGYGMLGEPGARMRNIIIKNALAFTERLPGIEQLTFSDGTPFANDVTRQWLDECRASASGSGPTDNVGQALQQAKKAIVDGAQEQALALYQSIIQGTHAGRDQLRARIALAQLFMTTRGDADPVPFVQSLADDCQTYNLALWEPGLASKAWQTVSSACKQALALPAPREDNAKLEHYRQLHALSLRQLARIDFPAALRYST